nr:ABC transporter substrate-binding protein [Kibdelosporangium sp. MJ126-NF4]CEL14101.1 Iron(III) dicitrate transport system, periplasmic iron-binding protein FecB (TC 3.A.1.14.1) [Kibdelosporangium sp. MJ126-NF4]CTQ88467.1 Iron(III) dicitrate transport system, periplasmic iron-binding protein FecB (TC 3.A.1.14.1) [Kibdelosporangium sp. MJ126-NF4]
MYDQLSAVAPTVVLLIDNQYEGWRLGLERLAPILGRTAQADQIRAEYRDTVTALKNTYGDQLGRTRWSAIGAVTAPGSWSLYHPSSAIASLLADAGVQFGRETATQSFAAGDYSLEKLGLIADSDVIVYPVGNAGPTAQMRDLLDQPTFKQLPAVRAGRVFPIRRHNNSLVSYRVAIGALGEVESILKKL